MTVVLATEGDRPIIEGLSQFYIYDFSEMEPADSAAFEFNERGLFAPYPHLDDYWKAENHWPLLIKKGALNVGFALINTHSHRDGKAIEHNMAEFFVARKHRRHGVAAEAARQIFALYPGRWEVAVAERNVAAKSFWPKAIAACTNVSHLTAHQGDGKHWRGPIYTFTAKK